MKTNILIADDQPEVLNALSRSLQSEERSVHAFRSGREAVAFLRRHASEVDLAILDLDFGPDEPDGLEILRQTRELAPDLPVIILTGKGTIDTAVSALRLGATDFIEKDFYLDEKLELGLEKLDRMLSVLRENAELREQVDSLDRENRFYRDEFGSRYQTVSASPAMQNVLQQAERIASIPRPVLVLGERGTGKELVAGAIHFGGVRKTRPFVKVNCAALSSTLLESELFGHEKGAFTGADEARPGRFEAADGGTLFLDEIANTSPEFQQNVLRAIEYNEVQRVGSPKPIPVDVRIITATNADLEQEIASGKFREDLYDRLRFEVIRIPPIRERREDIRPLAEFFVAEISKEVAGPIAHAISKAAFDRLLAYSWPGNVRELKFAVERAACVAASDTIQPGDLPPEVAGETPDASEQGFEKQVETFELGLLRQALRSAGWNQRQAASHLGLSYDQFRHLYRKYHLDREKP